MNRQKITVIGCVQGIGFRWFVKDNAEELSIIGWVRNLPNGDVELDAQGFHDDMQNFIETIKTGHPEAVVKDIKLEELPEQSIYSNFSIKF